MSDVALLLLKYFTTALSVAIAFAGSWLFEYTKKDETTGRRSLTPAGRWGVVLTLVSLGCAGLLSALTDYENAQTQAKQKVQIAAEQRELREWRNKTVTLQEQAQKVELENKEINEKSNEYLKKANESLAILAQNMDKLSPESRGKVRELVQGLNTTEDIRKQYPDLYEAAKEARSYSDMVKNLGLAYETKMRERAGDCGTKLVEYTGGTQGQVFDLSNGLTFEIFVEPSAVELTVAQTDSRKIDWSDGYKFVFGDTESPNLRCGRNRDSVFIRSCKDRVGTPELTAYKLLQTKLLTGIKIKAETYPVAPQLADTIMPAVACVKP
jgi:hypothetical protein